MDADTDTGACEEITTDRVPIYLNEMRTPNLLVHISALPVRCGKVGQALRSAELQQVQLLDHMALQYRAACCELGVTPTTNTPTPIPPPASWNPAPTPEIPKPPPRVDSREETTENSTNIGKIIGVIIVGILVALLCLYCVVKKIKMGTSDNGVSIMMPPSAPPQNPGFNDV